MKAGDTPALPGGVQPPAQAPPYLLLQHVLALPPHLLHQLRQVGDAVPRLHLLHGRVQQAERAGATHPRAAERPPAPRL